MNAPVTVDVLDVTDLRFAGGTTASTAEEIRAQSAAGWRTGLLHLDGPLVARAAPVHPGIRRLVESGAARLVLDEPVDAEVVVLRHPAVVEHGLATMPEVRARHVVMVANATPYDVDGHRHYDPARVHRMLEDRFGVAPVWAPISPAVRTAVTDRLPTAAVLPGDWVNVVDVDAWEVSRSTWAADRPVIGRHSRPAPAKWPTDAATLRTVYPTDGSVHVRVLGGADPAVRLLGSLPPSWTVLPFGAVEPRAFLAGLDFFVYYHDPALVEGFGRTVLEAVASGLPALVPPSFKEVFGDAVIAVEPGEVRSTVQALYADRDAYDEHVHRAGRLVRQQFGHEAHVGRLAHLAGLTPTSPHGPTSAPPRPAFPAAGTGTGTGTGTSKPSAQRSRPRTPRSFVSRVLRRRLLPWLRRRPSVRRVATQILLPPDTPRPDRSAAPGTVVTGTGVEELPVAVVLVVGLEPPAVETAVRQVAELQLLGAGFRPVLAGDRPAPDGTHRFGYTWEQLPTPRPAAAGTDLRRHLGDLVRAYGARTVVTATADGLDATGRAVLGAFDAAQSPSASATAFSSGAAIDRA